MIANGADVNARASDGSTPLHWAAPSLASHKSTKNVVALLIKKGADVNAKNNEGATAYC